MNVKLIARAMHTLSLLSEEDVAMVMNLRGLSDDERQTLLLVLEPDKPQKKAGKKSASKDGASETERTFKRCDICNLTKRADVHKDTDAGGYHEFKEKKSARASSLQTAITNRRGASGDNQQESGSDTRCQFTRADNRPCHLLPDHNIHHLESAAEYHEFQSPEKAVASSGD